MKTLPSFLNQREEFDIPRFIGRVGLGDFIAVGAALLTPALFSLGGGEGEAAAVRA